MHHVGQDDVLLFNVILATARVHVRDPAAAERRRRQRQLRWIRAASGVSSSEQEEDGGDDEVRSVLLDTVW